MKTAFTTSFGAGLLILGMINIPMFYFIINLSHYHDLWWEVINTANVSPITLFFAYLEMVISAGFITVGIIIMVVSDSKADLSPKEFNLNYLKNEVKKQREPSFYYRMMWISIVVETLAAVVLYITGMKILKESFLDWYVMIILFLALLFTLMLNKLGKRAEKTMNKSQQ